MKRISFVCLVGLLCMAIFPGRTPAAAASQPDRTAPASPLAAELNQPAAPNATFITDAGGISGFELVANDQSPNPSKSIHWWYTKGINGCGGEFPNSATVRFRSTMYGTNRTLVNNCPALQSSGSVPVRDSQYMYFFEDGQLVRKPLNALAADPAQPLVNAPALTGGLGSTPLAMDQSGRLYWANWNNNSLRIYRMLPDNVDTPHLFTLISSASSAVSQLSTYRYTALSGNTINYYDGVVWNNNGNLWRFQQDASGGSNLVLSSGVGSFWVRRSFGLLGPSATVYAQKTSALWRYTLAGAATKLYQSPLANNLIDGITTDANNIYIEETSVDCSGFCVPTDGVILRRALSAADNASWTQIVASGAAGHLRSDGVTLFYRGFDGITIRTISTSAPGIKIDLQATGIEVTQAIQDMNHSFPLVSGHPTVVRGYATVASSTGDSEFKVTARLTVKRNGVAIPGFLEPIQSVTVNKTNTMSQLRVNVTKAFLFEIPTDYVKYEPTGFPPQSNMTFEFTVNPYGDPLENVGGTPFANNKISRTISVDHGTRPCLMMIPMRTEAPVLGHNPPELPQMIARVRALMPVKNFRVFTNYTSTDLEDNWILSDDGDPYDFNHDPADKDDDDDDGALDDLGDLDAWSDEWSNCVDLHWVGMAHPSTPAWYGGISYRDDVVLISKMRTGTGDNPDFGPGGGSIITHELGHNYGRRHIQCGNFPDGQDNFDWVPYNPCELYFTNLPLSTNFIGFDTITRQTILPDDASDIMSYSSPHWASWAWWATLRTAIPNFESLQRPAADVAVGPTLYLSGRISELDHSGAFNTLYQTADGVAPAANLAESLAKAQAVPAAGHAPSHESANYTIRLVDANGATLSSTAVVTTETSIHQGDTHVLSFRQFVPYNAQTRRIQLLSDSTIIAQAKVSAHAPTVALQPLEQDNAAQTVHLNWTAADIDQQDLHALIQYSTDNGATWRALEKNITGMEATISTKGLPGSAQARFRVIIDDGVLTAIATSETITIGKHAPEVLLDGVIENQRLPFSGTLKLDGMALDADEGSLDSEQLAWALSGPQSKSFTGDQVTLRNLAPGQYTLTLAATDSDGMNGSAVRHFEVLPILVPTATGTPNVDGFCSDGAYENGVDLLLSGGVDASLLHAGSDVYICFRGLTSSATATPNIAGIRIDANNSKDAIAQSGDRGFFIGEDNMTFQTVGNGSGMPITASPAFGFTAYAEKTQTGWSAELQIDESLVGGWNHLAGLMLQVDVNAHTLNTHNYPQTAIFDHPNTWSAASFGAAIATPNRAPTANAGTDQTVSPLAPTEVYLDGTASADADLNSLTYAWTQVAGPSVTLTSAITATPSFTLSPVQAPTTLTFQLVVHDGSVNSVADTVSITALPPKQQMVPARVYIPIIIK